MGFLKKAEGSNIVNSLTSWIPKILILPEALSFGIERTYRSLVKPATKKTPHPGIL